MAARKRRRNYTFMSQTQRSTQEDGTNAPDNTNTTDATMNNSNTDGAALNNTQTPTLNNSNTTGPSTRDVTRKKGREPAIGYQGKEKLKIIFNKHMQPIGDTSTDVGNILGDIARCGARAPLDVVSWTLMPSVNLDLMWRDVQHKTDAPEAFKKTCLMTIGAHWKKWKSRVKANFFTLNKDDPVELLTNPSDSRVDPHQWPALVDYWQDEKVKAQS